MGRSITVVVPSSSANLGPGFDVFSVALQHPRLKIRAELNEDGRFDALGRGPYASEVDFDPRLHAGVRAARNFVELHRPGYGVSFSIDVGIPARKGLGLSGAEAAGAVFTLNELLESGISREELVPLAAEAEPGQHLDNVAASLLGGFIICLRDSVTKGVVVKRLQPPNDLAFVVIVPDVLKPSTEAARLAVPEKVERAQHVEATSRVAFASLALASGDVNLLLRAVALDPFVEPARAEAGIYGSGVTAKMLTEEKRLLLERFHVAETISGAGPSRLLWYRPSENKEPRGRRPIDKAIEAVVTNLLSVGHKVLNIFETGPSDAGCMPVG